MTEGGAPVVWRGDCAVADCGRPVEAGGLCAAHRKRLARGRPLHPPIRLRGHAWERLEAAAAAFQLDGTDEEYRRACWRLRKAAETWAAARGWSPPAVGQGEAVPAGCEDEPSETRGTP